MLIFVLQESTAGEKKKRKEKKKKRGFVNQISFFLSMWPFKSCFSLLTSPHLRSGIAAL